MLIRSRFLSAFSRAALLTEREQRVLSLAGVESPEDIMVLASDFPTVAKMLDMAKITTAVMQGAAGAPPRAAHMERRRRQSVIGARAPHNTPTPVGYAVDESAWQLMDGLWPAMKARRGARHAPSGVGQKLASVDLRLTDWEVRDQGDRGTCVAFSLAACCEYRHIKMATLEGGYLSPQFAFWAAKEHDGLSGEDGTTIDAGLKGVATRGICGEAHWPYDPAAGSSVTHGDVNHPSDDARRDARSRRRRRRTYKWQNVRTGGARLVYNALASTRRPVAVSVGVYQDPQGAGDNWSTNAAWSYGKVFDPQPGCICIGGHAVCVTGFVPDASEALGGFFIFRNSWGRQWGALGGDASRVPAPGYGEISATYMEKYLWELGQL